MWLRQQWYRFQLARDLLRSYEYEEEHRMGYGEAMRRLEEAGYLGRATHESGVAKWRAEVEKHLDRYPSG